MIFFAKKQIISGCESRGDAHQPYLTRWTLFQCPYFQICLHKFHRSDADDLHDHPWDFVTIPLFRGYIEQTPVKLYCPTCNKLLCESGLGYTCVNTYCWNNDTVFVTDNYDYKPVTPFIPHFRGAKHQHRVILMDNKPVYTLVIMGKRKRLWGFVTKHGWVNFVKYFKINKC